MEKPYKCVQCGAELTADEFISGGHAVPDVDGDGDVCGQYLCGPVQIDTEWATIHIASAAARIAELEAEIQTRRLDYTEDCKRLDAAINDLEHQLAAAQERNVALQSEHLNHVNALHEKLTAMTAERDSESRCAKHYSDKVTELEQQLAAKQRIIDSYRRMI